MSAAHQDSTQVVTTTGTTCSVPKPTITDGSTVTVILFSRGSNSITTPASGFTEVTDAEGNTGTSGSQVRVWVFRKYIPTAAGQPATYDFIFSAAVNGGGVAFSSTGADPTDPVIDAAYLSDASTNATVDAPSVDTTGVSNALVYRFVAMNTNDGIASWSTADCTEVEDVAQAAATNRLGAALGHEVQVVGGATGVATWTVTLVGGSVNYGAAAGVTIALAGAQVAAIAGANQTVDPGDIVTLNGSASTGTIVTKSWTPDPANPQDLTDFLVDADQLTARFIAPGPGNETFTFELEVVGAENTSQDEIDIIVREPTVGGPSLGVQLLGPDGLAV